jgi:hypothetical protein
VTFATPPVAGTATADSTGTFTLTFNAAGVPFGCFILDPAGNSIATLVFTSGTLNSLTVSFSQNGGLGTIIVDGTSGLAQAILTSGGTLVTSAPSGTCPLGTWIANIGDVGCSTPLIATIWIAQSPTGQYLVSSYSGPEGHLNCAYQGGGAIPATYANGVLSFIGGSINSCNVTSMVTLTPDAQCQTATISMTQVCGTCDGGSQCCGPQTCTTNLTAQRQGTGRADAGVDRGTDASLGCPQPASGAACNSVPVFGMVTPTCSTAAAPTPQGGTLADGTYVLQSLTTYSPAQYCDIGPNIQETVAISGSCEQATFIQTPTSASSPSFVQNLTIQADAGVINGTVTCPTGTSSLANKIPYTAGPGGQLTFFGPNTNGSCDGGQCPGTSVFVLQKQ